MVDGRRDPASVLLLSWPPPAQSQSAQELLILYREKPQPQPENVLDILTEWVHHAGVRCQPHRLAPL